MYRLFRPVIELLLYGNFWIAASAIAQVVLTHFLLTGVVFISNYAWCLGAGTLSLYGLHRIVGLTKVYPFQSQGRYAVIHRYRKHIKLYVGLGVVVTITTYASMRPQLQWACLLPGMLSLAYVLPLYKGWRLRDLHYIKIFLVAGVWAYLSVYLPALEIQKADQSGLWSMTLERALFVFALTLPFDYRDREIDSHTQVKTLPMLFGRKGINLLIAISYLLSSLLVLLQYGQGQYEPSISIGLLVFYSIAAYLCLIAHRFKHDYYFTGLLDGLLGLQLLVVLLD